MHTTGRDRFWRWFLEGKEHTIREAPYKQAVPRGHTHAWWQVMCLTGVDYFSTLGYQPGIALIAAQALSPFATLILVLVTLFGALPMYRRVAEASPHGQGSIAMLEHLLPRWRGKALVLILLGFAATGFVITITLSAADATAHIIENPLAPHWIDHPLLVTFALLLALGAIMLKGFKEAIGVAVVIVAVYLLLNVITVGRGILEIATHPEAIPNWVGALTAQTSGDPVKIALLAVVVFPRLALGLSGFETGVAVMPLVKGEPNDTHERPLGRIRNTRKLLTTAALIMSVMLIGSSAVTTLLIPREAYVPGGEAYGRALSYLTHEFFGHTVGTLYDLSTIAILWFAGASALAGLLTLVPRYLPRYGMAPDWAKATRPLVVVILLVTLLVTWAFDADVEKQAGAYATGVLGLMTSGAVAVTLMLWRSGWIRWPFLLITIVFVYALVANIYEQPSGIKISSFFVGSMIVTSLFSRAFRSTELRHHEVILDDAARQFVDEALRRGTIRVVTNRPDTGTVEEYDKKEREARESHHIPPGEEVLLLEVQPGDASEFADTLQVSGHRIGRFHVLRCESPAIPNAIAAFLLHVRDTTGKIPHVYFGWTEGNPLAYVLKYIAFGEGDTAPVTREVLRQAVDEPLERPRVHVG
jgi:hypothetical protein